MRDVMPRVRGDDDQVRLLLLGGPPYVVEYDDAVFHQYDSHASGLVRRVLGRKHDRLMARAATVIAEQDVRGLCIGGEALRAILQERPEAAMAMLATLAERITYQ